MDLVNLALVQKAVRDAHVDHIGPPGPKGDKGDKGDPLTWDDLTEEQKASLKGADGKSAYQYAVDGGYTGTKAEFAAKLAAEIPQADWNQNDSTAADYVKNRPFYSKTELQHSQLFARTIGLYTNSVVSGVGTTLSKSLAYAYFSYPSGYDIAKPIELTLSSSNFAEKTYTLTLQSGDVSSYSDGGKTMPPSSTTSYYGDKNFVTYPFCVLAPTSSEQYFIIYVLTDEFGSAGGGISVTLKQELSVTSVKKLDGKFIPDTIARTNAVMSNSNPTATGSFSMGRKSGTTVGSDSHAEGYSTTASGSESHAEGSYTTASGDNSHTEGNGTTASANSAHAEGSHTTASGISSHTEGGDYDTTGSKYLSNRTISASTDPNISADIKIRGSTAKGIQSHAEGTQTLAYGYSSHAEGSYTTASGSCAHAEGGGTTASGSCAHAEGSGTTASGTNSHAEGFHITASGANQHVQGKYNIEDTDSTYAHIVGNGTSNTERSNAHILDWSGNAWYAGSVYVGGDETNYNPETAKKLATEEYVQNLIGAVDELLGSGVLS